MKVFTQLINKTSNYSIIVMLEITATKYIFRYLGLKKVKETMEVILYFSSIFITMIGLFIIAMRKISLYNKKHL